jgi:hypothetical protein
MVNITERDIIDLILKPFDESAKLSERLTQEGINSHFLSGVNYPWQRIGFNHPLKPFQIGTEYYNFIAHLILQMHIMPIFRAELHRPDGSSFGPNIVLAAPSTESAPAASIPSDKNQIKLIFTNWTNAQKDYWTKTLDEIALENGGRPYILGRVFVTASDLLEKYRTDIATLKMRLTTFGGILDQSVGYQ